MLWVMFKEEYLERLCTRSPSSGYHKNARTILDRFTLYCGLRERALDEITNRDLDLYVRRRLTDIWRKKPIGNRTINNEVDLLNQLFSYAGPRTFRGSGRKNLGLISDPPYAERLPEDTNLPVVVMPGQLEAFVAAAEFATSPICEGCTPQEFWLAALVLGLVGGLRRGAAIRIPRPEDDVLIGQRQIILPAKLSKTRCEQRIVLSGKAVEILARMPTKPGEPLLPWKDAQGLPMTLEHFSETFKLLQRRAGVPEQRRIRFKDFRSTAATVTLDEFGESVAKKKLGHSPHTNTINTNYKGRIVSSKDVAASEHLSTLVPPLNGFTPRIYSDGESA